MRTIAAFPFYCCLVLMLFLLAACNSVQKATDYLRKKQALAEVCAVNYPVRDSAYVRDSLSFDTLYVPGDPVILKDSFYIHGDTIIRTISKQCPKEKTIVQTIRHDSVIIRENTAKQAALQIQMGQLQGTLAVTQSKLEDMKKGRSRWRLWCLITWAVVGGYVALKIYSPLKL